MDITLHYVHDPMCSWCWGYKPTLTQLKSQLPANITFNYLVGGLAPDSEEPMPVEMQQKLESIWHTIQQQLGTEFDFDYWTSCQPVRTTYQACRALIAAGFQDRYEEMLEAIQKAYYLRAMLPHAKETHEQLAQEIGLDVNQFRVDVGSRFLEEEFEHQLDFARAIGVHSYPSLVLEVNGKYFPIKQDYKSTEPTLQDIRERLVAELS